MAADTTHRGPFYSGALAFANHWFTTNRIAVGDILTANFDGQSYAARGEAGYRYAVPVTGLMIGVTPYAALQTQDFHTRASETDLTGGGLGTRLRRAERDDTRSELGTRFDNVQIVNDMPLVLRGRWPGRMTGSRIRRSARCSRRCRAELHRQRRRAADKLSAHQRQRRTAPHRKLDGDRQIRRQIRPDC